VNMTNEGDDNRQSRAWTRWGPVSEDAAKAHEAAERGEWEAAQTYALLYIGHELHRIDRRLDNLNDTLEAHFELNIQRGGTDDRAD
jgi:hypothetical protein